MRQQSAGPLPDWNSMSGSKHHGPFGNLLILTDGGSHACTADLLIAADAARRGGEIGQRLTRCARPDLASMAMSPD
jgi:hypothetical protein